jgi:hypothetical protein
MPRRVRLLGFLVFALSVIAIPFLFEPRSGTALQFVSVGAIQVIQTSVPLA